MAKKNKLSKHQQRDNKVRRHAEYEGQQEKIHAPFGKTFKTGGHKTGKNDISRKRAKQTLRREID